MFRFFVGQVSKFSHFLLLFSSWRIDTRMRNIDKVLRLKSTSFFYSKISQSKLILGQGNLFDLFDFDLLWSKVLYESRF